MSYLAGYFGTSWILFCVALESVFLCKSASGAALCASEADNACLDDAVNLVLVAFLDEITGEDFPVERVCTEVSEVECFLPLAVVKGMAVAVPACVLNKVDAVFIAGDEGVEDLAAAALSTLLGDPAVVAASSFFIDVSLQHRKEKTCLMSV